MASLSLAKPRLRGVSHQIAFYVAAVAGLLLVTLLASSGRTVGAIALYVSLLAGMFGVSATFHRINWGPRAFGWWRRVDHSMIFATIAGTYTPFCLLALEPPTSTRLLALAWTGAALGILRAMLWPGAPRVITALLYVAVGWVMIAYFPEVHAALDPFAFALVLVGGGCFTLGAVVYALRWPDPVPAVFGFHEVFHILIILGCAAHFIAVVRVALAS
jgi:hemolysin III